MRSIQILGSVDGLIRLASPKLTLMINALGAILGALRKPAGALGPQIA